MTIILTAENVSVALDAAVAKRGADYVYPGTDQHFPTVSCEYIKGGEPSCIVGEALVSLGVPVEVFAEPMSSTGQPRNVVNARSVLEELRLAEIVDIEDPRIAYRLMSVQRAQDSGETWGSARERFDLS